MKLSTKWNDKLRFTADTGKFQIPMDTTPPLGSDTAPSPKQLLLAAACGCTGMDLVSLLKKFRQPLEALEIEADAELTEGGFPVIFRKLTLTYYLRGAIEADKALEAVRLSMTRYCSVNAMLSRAFPVHYTVHLNSELIGGGQADFSQEQP
jgi:putative redox protein